ncbi:MAG: LuxR C-terminal-related transcriptional regulator [Ruminococcus sp.]
MFVWYGITFVASLVLVAVCGASHRRENPLLLWLFISIAVTNAGYFALSLSPNITLALCSNALAYLGSVFLPVCMLLIIADLCKVAIPRWLLIVFLSLAVVIFLIASSGGYSDVYYETVSLKQVYGSSVLKKTYGPLHPVYKMYIVAYLLGMVGIIIYSFVRKSEKNLRVSSFLAVIVSINIGVWLLESIMHSEFEYLSVVYVVTEVLLLLFYSVIREYTNAVEKLSVKEQPVSCFTVEESEKILSLWQSADALSKRETDVFKLLIEGKRRKEIAEELFVTESTIKKHSSSIYRKLGVENRKELLSKIRSEVNV